MKEMIETIVKALVDQPDEVLVTEVGGEYTTIIELKVSKSDLGKVIGKHGRNADALRTIIAAASVKYNKRIVLEIMQ